MPLSGEHYDLVVIGAGIHGAGVAQVFAANHYRVLLLERNTIASQTSSRSSKLIHGGLRYLETFQFSLVRQCLRERNILLKIAPELVRLQPFFIPVYQSACRSQWMIRAGLSLYACLGGLDASVRFRKCRQSQWDGLDGLKTQRLKAVFQYFDAQTNDLELTRAVAASATSRGALILESTEFIGAQVNTHGVGIDYRDDQGQEKSCVAKMMVNTAGPWVNEVAACFDPKPPMANISLVQGAHLVIKRKLNKGIYYIESPIDQRAVFVMPWGEKTLLGTTETSVAKLSSDIVPTKDEVNYLLQTYNYFFPEIGTSNIDSQFAGVRVLPGTAGVASQKRRDTDLIVDNKSKPRIISVYGGKLTAYRCVAEKVYYIARATLGTQKKYNDTRLIKLNPP